MAQPEVQINDLLRIPFLSGLQTPELEALLRGGTSRTQERDDVIFHAGDDGSELFVLLDGEVAIELPVEGGPPKTLATLSGGTVFGEVSFLLGSERTASARALRATRLLAFTREGLEGVSAPGRQAVMSMIETIARILALRLSNVDRELAEICARIRVERPDADTVLETLEDRRRRVHQDWRGID